MEILSITVESSVQPHHIQSDCRNPIANREFNNEEACRLLYLLAFTLVLYLIMLLFWLLKHLPL